MQAADIFDALQLPAACRVDQRVPKKLLLENGAPTAADERQVSEGIEEIFWWAALKPQNIGVPAYADAEREYLEIAVMRLALRAGARHTRLIELLHRAIPYPVFLVVESSNGTSISVAHKRWAQNEAGKVVLDGELVLIEHVFDPASGIVKGFLASLALSHQPRVTLHALYEGWLDALYAWKAAKLTGVFSLPNAPERVAARRVALSECARLEGEMVQIRGAAAKETQMARKVELNNALKRMETALAAARAQL